MRRLLAALPLLLLTVVLATAQESEPAGEDPRFPRLRQRLRTFETLYAAVVLPDEMARGGKRTWILRVDARGRVTLDAAWGKLLRHHWDGKSFWRSSLGRGEPDEDPIAGRAMAQLWSEVREGLPRSRIEPIEPGSEPKLLTAGARPVRWARLELPVTWRAPIDLYLGLDGETRRLRRVVAIDRRSSEILRFAHSARFDVTVDRLLWDVPLDPATFERAHPPRRVALPDVWRRWDDFLVPLHERLEGVEPAGPPPAPAPRPEVPPGVKDVDQR